MTGSPQRQLLREVMAAIHPARIVHILVLRLISLLTAKLA